jgi:uncharacterized protein YcbK (DUF882 family)
MKGRDVSDHMNPEFLIKLDTCRDMCGFPFVVTSSYRSPEDNRRVGGSPGSMHLKGRAVDIRVSDGAMRWAVVKAAISLGLSVGVMRDALHLDDREGPIVFHYYKTIPAGNSEDE